MRLRMLGVSLVAAVVTLGIAAAPAQAASATTQSSHTVTTYYGHYFGKGRTELTLDPAAADALTSLGVRVSPVLARQSQRNGRTVFGFTIVGNTKDNTIEHVGGLKLRASHKSVYLTGYTIDLNRGILSGQINFGGRADLFTLGASTPDGVTLALTAPAASLLNTTFGVTAFAEGLVIGYGDPQLRK